jgi:hypothetical protein
MRPDRSTTAAGWLRDVAVPISMPHLRTMSCEQRFARKPQGRDLSRISWTFGLKFESV